MSSCKSPRRLCIYCRAFEPMDEPCPVILRARQSPGTIVNKDSPASGLSRQDAQQIWDLQQEPSTLCARCSDCNPIDMLMKPLALDTELDEPISRRNIYERRFRLGPPSSIILTPSCQLCRLLYCILPRRFELQCYHTDFAKSIGKSFMEEEDVYLGPFSTYRRKGEWSHFSGEILSRHAIHLGLHMSAGDAFRSLKPSSTAPFRGGSAVHTNGPAIGLETRFMPSDRNLSNFTFIEDTPDMSILGQVLNNCLQNHGDYCRGQYASDLTSTRMIDVVDRTVVSYPQECDYFALSYVWGGISPSSNALENKCLPRTIEDAIKVTKALGRRYLWVDALCIDQSPNPTEAQMEEKRKQLDLMGTIYNCATVTLVAETGDDGAAGLSGISAPRLAQLKENIDGYVLFTVPQEHGLEVEDVTWSRRAWTYQEELLSRRMLRFNESQVLFDCVINQFEEGMDTTTFIKDGPPELPINRILPYTFRLPDYDTNSFQTTQPKVIEKRFKYFTTLLSEYTGRRMTYESDSLNAFRGVLQTLQKQPFPEGFVHGLPLRSHPASLAWMHVNSVMAKRRAEFPSWCWTGWEGQVRYWDQLQDDANAHWSNASTVDFELRFVSCHGNELEVEGWVVDLDVRTEPLSELFIPGQDDSIAAVKEGNSAHNNTLNTGRYNCLVIQRNREKLQGGKSLKETIYLLALDQRGQQIYRQAMLSVWLWPGCSFDQVQHRKEVIKLV